MLKKHDLPDMLHVVTYLLSHKGLMHSVVGTAANVNDVTQGHRLLHDQGLKSFPTRDIKVPLSARMRPVWTGIRPSTRKVLDMGNEADHLTDKIEQIKASILAKIGHPFRVIKRQFGLT